MLLFQPYFKLANKLKLVDIPNERSSHSTPTYRGGGIVWAFLFLVYLLFFTEHLLFTIAFFIGAMVALADDLVNLNAFLRLFGYLTATVLILLEADTSLSVMTLIIFSIILAGVINAVNFMDGINSITGLYAIVFIASMWYIDSLNLNYLNDLYYIIPLGALIAFGFYNFKRKAKTFAGDVGSVSLAIIFLFPLCYYLIYMPSLFWILFLAVYGVDSVLTIIVRLYRKENIFKAHRSHAYQLLANNAKMSHLKVGALYAFTQLIINLISIYLISQNYLFKIELLILFFVLLSLSIIYFVIRKKYPTINLKETS